MRIHHVMVFVSNMKRSVTFYRDVIGLPLLSSERVAQYADPAGLAFSVGKEKR